MKGAAAPALTSSTTRGAALAAVRSGLSDAGIEDAALDARVLLCAVLGINAVTLAAHPEAPLGVEGARAAAEAMRRRLSREPVARILGRREFWGMELELSPDTLVPRADTETIVATALRHLPGRNRPLALADLGTGSGCLLLALLRELPQAHGLGIDRSADALATARRNAHRNGVGARAFFAASDWTAAVGGGFHLLVANPPYIPSGDIAGLAPEVRDHDPRAALDGGADGLAAFRAILADASRVVAPGGLIVLEIGFDQGRTVPALAVQEGYTIVEVACDLAGRSRAVALKPPLS